jgi:outer membrane protein assembly factor BamE
MMRLGLIIILVLLSSCILRPYKVTVQQGNVISEEALRQLKVGMNKAEVQKIMGTPLHIDPFNPDAWDYVYRLQKPYTPLEERIVSLYFKDDKLVRIEDKTIAKGKNDHYKRKSKDQRKDASS